MKHIKNQTFLLFMFMVSCTNGVKQYQTHTDIIYHEGGVIYKVMGDINKMKKPIRVTGLCASSCTYVFSFDDTCVMQDSQIIIHTPLSPDGRTNNSWLTVMAQWYPEKMKMFFLKKVHSAYNYIFTGQQLHDNFDIKICPNIE